MTANGCSPSGSGAVQVKTHEPSLNSPPKETGWSAESPSVVITMFHVVAKLQNPPVKNLFRAGFEECNGYLDTNP